MQHTETHCHCGADRLGSDHCPECQCEEFESVCDHVHILRRTRSRDAAVTEAPGVSYLATLRTKIHPSELDRLQDLLNEVSQIDGGQKVKIIWKPRRIGRTLLVEINLLGTKSFIENASQLATTYEYGGER